MRSLFLVVALSAIACGDSPDAPIGPDAVTGTWGGDRVRLTLAADGGQLEFDCAHGVMTSPLAPRTDGTFSVPGYYVVENGAIREPEGRRPTTFTGRVDGTTITISFLIADQPLGPYTLVRDRVAILRKCL
jgi:hypothetical protein